MSAVPVGALLLVLAGVLALQLLPRALAGRAALTRSPRLAVVLWHAVLLGGSGSVVLGALALAVPDPRVGHGLGDLFTVCDRSLRAAYGDAQAGPLPLLGVVVAFGTTARLARGTQLALRRCRGERRTVHHLLSLLAAPAPDVAPGVLRVGSPTPSVYCLPGPTPFASLLRRRRGCIVLAGEVSERLQEEELRAVLAHEHAHLDQRHHVALLLSDALALALPLAGVRLARVEVARLLEMAADDAAVRLCDPRTLAAALLRVAAPGRAGPAGAFAAADTAVVDRVSRLLAPSPALSRPGRASLALAAAGALLLPLAVAAAPGLALASGRVCGLVG